MLEIDTIEIDVEETDPVAMIKTLLAAAEMRLREERFDSALEAYERVLAFDGVNQAAKKGLVTVSEARQQARDAKKVVPLDKVPILMLGSVALSQQQFDPQEGFLLSRINGHWDVRSILKLCPLPEAEALVIFNRLWERKVIDLR